MKEEMKIRARYDLEECEKLLRKHYDANSTDDDMYHEFCGRVWAYRNLDLITLDAAFAWIDRFAAAAAGLLGGCSRND